MRNERVLVLVETALTVALCLVLNFISVRLPWNVAGGKVSLEMLPILVLALRRGVGPGVLAGAIWGGFDYLFDPVFVTPIQVLLDYPIAFGTVGLAGLGSAMWRSVDQRSGALAATIAAVPWMLLGMTGRFASSFLSGMIFFGSYAPKGQPVWLYSLLYNASYLLPSMIGCVAAALLVIPALQRAVPARAVRT